MKRKDIPTEAVLMACYNYENEISNFVPLEILMNKFKAPEKLILSAMERDLNKGYIDYGISLRISFITQKGRYLLNNKLTNK